MSAAERLEESVIWTDTLLGPPCVLLPDGRMVVSLEESPEIPTDCTKETSGG